MQKSSEYGESIRISPAPKSPNANTGALTNSTSRIELRNQVYQQLVSGRHASEVAIELHIGKDTIAGIISYLVEIEAICKVRGTKRPIYYRKGKASANFEHFVLKSVQGPVIVERKIKSASKQKKGLLSKILDRKH